MLEVAGIGITFGGLTALKDISFTVEPGQVLSVIGPNGAGKTTLFNIITGFLKPTTCPAASTARSPCRDHRR